MFDTRKSRMIGLPNEEIMTITLSRFHRIPEHVGQTDGRTDRIAISISRGGVSVLTRDRKLSFYNAQFQRYEYFWFGRPYCYFRLSVVVAIIWGHILSTRHSSKKPTFAVRISMLSIVVPEI